LTEIGGKIEYDDVLLTLIPPRQTQNTIRSSKNHTPWREEADDPNQQAVKGREAIAQISQLQVLLLDASEGCAGSVSTTSRARRFRSPHSDGESHGDRAG